MNLNPPKEHLHHSDPLTILGARWWWPTTPRLADGTVDVRAVLAQLDAEANRGLT